MPSTKLNSNGMLLSAFWLFQLSNGNRGLFPHSLFMTLLKKRVLPRDIRRQTETRHRILDGKSGRIAGFSPIRAGSPSNDLRHEPRLLCYFLRGERGFVKSKAEIFKTYWCEGGITSACG